MVIIKESVTKKSEIYYEFRKPKFQNVVFTVLLTSPSVVFKNE